MLEIYSLPSSPRLARSNSHTRIALARLGGSSASIRFASMRATSADSGRSSSVAASPSAVQKTGSRLMEVAWPAIATERLIGPATPLTSIHMLAAVDRQRRAGDEAAVLGDQERDTARNLRRVAEAADRDLGDDLLQHILGHRGDHVGVDIAGRDRVDGHAELGAFLRQRFGEAVDTGLGGGIVDLAVLAGLPVDRADVDDPSPAPRAHPREGRLGHVEATAEIGVDHRLPLLVGLLENGAVAGDAGIVNDDINGAEIVLDLLHAGEAGLMVAHVPLVGGDAGLLGEDLRLGVVAAIIGGHLQAHVTQGDADRLADPTGTTGHDRYAVHRTLPSTIVTSLESRPPAFKFRLDDSTQHRNSFNAVIEAG